MVSSWLFLCLLAVPVIKCFVLVPSPYAGRAHTVRIHQASWAKASSGTNHPLLRAQPLFAKKQKSLDRGAKGGSKKEESASSSPGATAPEDPQVVALKSTVATLEAELSALQGEIAEIQVQTAMNTKEGYMRLAAEVDNFKKGQRDVGKESELEERANIVRKLMPVYHSLDALGEKYVKTLAAGDDDDATAAAMCYSALQDNLMSKLEEVGLRKFHAEKNERVSRERHDVREEVISADVDAERVVREISRGYEISGNVVEKAKVVVSKGKPKEASKEEGIDPGAKEVDSKEANSI